MSLRLTTAEYKQAAVGKLVIALAYVEDIVTALVVVLASAMGMAIALVVALAFVVVGKSSMGLLNLESSQLANPLGHQHQGHFISYLYFYLKLIN